eukprot:14947913-Alexandrium_andersonii.AAC.1
MTDACLQKAAPRACAIAQCPAPSDRRRRGDPAAHPIDRRENNFARPTASSTRPKACTRTQ